MAKGNGPTQEAITFQACEKVRHVGDRMPLGTIMLFAGKFVPAGWEPLSGFKKEVAERGSHE